MSSEPNSTSVGTELHLETYTNPSEQVHAHKRLDIWLTQTHTCALHQKARYLIFAHIFIKTSITVSVHDCHCRGSKFPKHIG